MCTSSCNESCTYFFRRNFYYNVKPIKFGKDDLYPVTGSDQSTRVTLELKRNFILLL